MSDTTKAALVLAIKNHLSDIDASGGHLGSWHLLMESRLDEPAPQDPTKTITTQLYINEDGDETPEARLAQDAEERREAHIKS